MIQSSVIRGSIYCLNVIFFQILRLLKMGGQLSRVSTPEDVATYVDNLGPAYGQYHAAIIEDGIDGNLIAIVIADNNIECLIDEYVTNKVHALKIKSKFNEFTDVGNKSETTPLKGIAMIYQNLSHAHHYIVPNLRIG